MQTGRGCSERQVDGRRAILPLTQVKLRKRLALSGSAEPSREGTAHACRTLRFNLELIFLKPSFRVNRLRYCSITPHEGLESPRQRRGRVLQFFHRRSLSTPHSPSCGTSALSVCFRYLPTTAAGGFCRATVQQWCPTWQRDPSKNECSGFNETLTNLCGEPRV
jgi:hypothetical protein